MKALSISVSGNHRFGGGRFVRKRIAGNPGWLTRHNICDTRCICSENHITSGAGVGA